MTTFGRLLVAATAAGVYCQDLGHLLLEIAEGACSSWGCCWSGGCHWVKVGVNELVWGLLQWLGALSCVVLLGRGLPLRMTRWLLRGIADIAISCLTLSLFFTLISLSCGFALENLWYGLCLLKMIACTTSSLVMLRLWRLLRGHTLLDFRSAGSNRPVATCILIRVICNTLRCALDLQMIP